jgi:hypothetical protein
MLMVLLGSGTALATPSDSQVKKDLGGSNVIKVTLTSKPGTVQGNTDTMNYEYIRGAEILSKTDYPGVKMITTGDAVYQRTGRGKFSYWKFRVFDQRYEGIPNPTNEEIQKVLATKPAEQFGGIAGRIKNVKKPHVLAKEPQWVWHTPNSVSFQTVAVIDVPKSYTELETLEQTVEVRLYRDDMKGPWTGFITSLGERKVLGTTKHTEEELRNMPSFAQQIEEKAAIAELARLPKVDVPEFTSHDELAAYMHKLLLESPRDKAEATIRALLSPRNFATGSTTLLNHNGAQMLTWALDNAFPEKGPGYASFFCPNAQTETRGTRNRTYFIGVRPNIITVFVSTRAGGGYKDGVKVGEKIMLEEISVGSTDDQDTLAWIASFSDKRKICAAQPSP